MEFLQKASGRPAVGSCSRAASPLCHLLGPPDLPVSGPLPVEAEMERGHLLCRQSQSQDQSSDGAGRLRFSQVWIHRSAAGLSFPLLLIANRSKRGRLQSNLGGCRLSVLAA